MQGRLLGKREEAHFFLDETVEHGLEGCNYLLALDMEMDPQPGYAMASWERGYGDFHLLPDLATLRRVPWLEGTALVLCDVAWEDGSPVVASPRQVLAAQVERARAAGFEPMVGSELEFYLLKETYAEAHAKHYREPDAVGAVHPRLPRARDDLRRGPDPPDPQRDAGRRIPVESSKGEAWPGQHEINFRFADALRMADNHVIYKNGAKEIAHANGCSITFMAKPDHTWIGSSCHVHASLWRDGENAFARRRARSSTVPRRLDRVREASWRSSSRRTSTRTSATPPGAGRRPRSRGAATTARAASASSATAPRSASRRGSPAATSTRTSPSRR